jgi:hypothetical protein
VSASTAAASGTDKLPAWTASPASEGDAQAKGGAAAQMISTALQGMGLGANPWAKLTGTMMKRKPHKADDAAYQALLATQVGGVAPCARAILWSLAVSGYTVEGWGGVVNQTCVS